MFKEYLETINLYDEGRYALPQFTFGFELEGWGKTVGDRHNFAKWAENYFHHGKTINMSVMHTGYDASIHPDDGYDYGMIDCPECDGSGTWRCGNCYGTGNATVTCPECDGEGTTTNENEEVITCPRCDGEGSVQETCPRCDGSGRVDCGECEGRGEIEDEDEGDPRVFEWNSPIFNFTIENLGKIIIFLDEAVKKNIRTNHTCGFHIHIGFPERNNAPQDMFWVLCQMLMLDEGKIFNEIQSFKGFDLYEYTYARLEYLENTQKALYRVKNNVDKRMKRKSKNEQRNLANAFATFMPDYYSDVKYTILRQHPQGTLEWRGPRNFLNERKNISDFFIKKLYPFVKWINDTLELKYLQIGKYKMLKSTYQKVLKTSNAFKHPAERESKKIDRRFDRNQNMKKLPEIFKNNPWLAKKNIRFEDAILSLTNNKQLVFEEGEWKKGDFKGVFKGLFSGSNFLGGIFKKGAFVQSVFINGIFKKAKFENSIFKGGIFDGGYWFKNSTWEEGEWRSGRIQKETNFWESQFEYSNINPNQFYNLKAKEEIGRTLDMHLTRDLLGRIPQREKDETWGDYIDRASEKLKNIVWSQKYRTGDGKEADMEIEESINNKKAKEYYKD